MNFPSIRIEGAIISPDILDRLEELPGQRPADFGLDSSAKVKDEIARAWADAQDYWRIFRRKLASLKADASATTETRNLWVTPLLGLFGFQLEYQSRSTDALGKGYAISHHAANRGSLAVHVMGYRDPAGLDRKPERTRLRMSAHAMVQEYLNLSDQLYAIVTNGRLLRLLRDSSRLVKLTYLEFDLDRIFIDGLFADFAILYRLLHVTRLPVTADTSADSLIERYHQDSVESGARIRSGLSRAVEDAIRALANGLLAHPKNDALRVSVQSGSLKADVFYQHLLRLIYRLLFLLVIEERNLIYPLSPSAAKRDLYYRYYSLQRLRRLAEKRYLADHRKDDLWLALLACFRLFEAGGPGPKLGIAPLAGDLFGRDAIGPIGDCLLDNKTVLDCLRSLSLYQNPETGQTIRVNYAALNVEEFGSVYEGLLEYEPVLHSVGVHPEFVFAKGDERAATGSHYTPDDLVQPLIKHSLDYLIAEKLKESDKEKALLSLRVADIACGSGHILLAAARRIATELAVVRTGEEQPSPTAFRTAVRDVIRECIYGVDLNPLAVELCKVALWLEAHVPGEPLNFLDHHIRCGNAIVGFAHREEMERGVPNEAFATMPGDDKEVAATFRRRNKEQRATRTNEPKPLSFSPELRAQIDAILVRFRAVSALPERNPREIDAKKKHYEEFAAGKDAWLLQQIACIPLAQFYLPKTLDNRTFLITDGEFRAYLGGHRTPQGQATAGAWAMALRKHFFHWFLEFPDVIARGGFDCILGNPPYLMGRDISLLHGPASFRVLTSLYPGTGGVCDLVAFFLRRAFDMVRAGGSVSFITTKTIAEGDTRAGGLEIVLSSGGVINFAVSSTRWPGRAAVTVALLAITKGSTDRPKWLNGRIVDAISAHLDDDPTAPRPHVLSANSRRCFKGAEPLGEGFYLTREERDRLQDEDGRSAEVIVRYFSGDDLNKMPDGAASRWIINFGDWPIEKAERYPAALRRVRELVKPERDNVARPARRERWWLYGERAAGLHKRILTLRRFFGTANTSKYLAPIALPPNQVYANTVVGIVTESFSVFSVLQSCVHETWVRKFSSTMGKVSLRYTPSDVFETFPFPDEVWASDGILTQVGEVYHEHRRALMLALGLGITDIYNLFHDRNLTAAEVARMSKKTAEAETGHQGILQLRSLHRELDEAVLAAYGWTGQVALGHDFHEVESFPENDRVRYTISSTARKEILRRLLALNRERHAQEVAAATIATAAKKSARKPKPKPADALGELNLGIDIFDRVGAPVATVHPKRQIPSGKRYMAISEAHYLFSLIPTVLDEAGKVIDWDDFVRAIIFLGRPDVIQPSLVGELAQEAEAWRQRGIQPFSLRSVIPVVRELGAANLSLEVRDGRHFLHLRSHRPDPLLDDFAYDANLAVRVVRATTMPVALDTEMRVIREAAPDLAAALA